MGQQRCCRALKLPTMPSLSMHTKVRRRDDGVLDMMVPPLLGSLDLYPGREDFQLSSHHPHDLERLAARLRRPAGTLGGKPHRAGRSRSGQSSPSWPHRSFSRRVSRVHHTHDPQRSTHKFHSF
jgi:hypothetical protein